MKIEVTRNAEVSITSSSKDERLFLLEIYGKSQQSKATAIINVMNASKEGQKRRTNYLKSCDVVGCNKKFKGKQGVSAHKQRNHGISKDGDKKSFFSFKGKDVRVSHPVYMNNEAKYEVDTGKLRHDQD